MRIQKVLLAAAAALTLAAPAAALADPHDSSGDHRGDVHRGYDDRGDRDGRSFRHHHHRHHDHREDRRWR
jgi:hypothetical protein